MKRLMIIGASILQLPAIKEAKKMGLYVGVIDYNPKAIGIPLADEYFNVSTIDEEGVYHASRQFRADGIMTLATDLPMRSVAYTCEKMGLPGITYKTAIRTTNKYEMIKAFEEKGLAHPRYAIISKDATEIDIDKAVNYVGYPSIVKPTDNSGSRGVVLLNNPNDIASAIDFSRAHIREGALIVEEYMRGPEVSAEVIVFDGIPYIIQITDKLTCGAPHFVELGHSQPSQLSSNDQESIKELATSAVLSVGIENGAAHVEIIVTTSGPKLIELGSRLGGDCITSHLVPLSTGVNMVKNTIQIALAEAPNFEQKKWKGSAVRYFKVFPGVIKSISGVKEALEIEGVKEVSFTRTIGDRIVEIKNSTDRIGYVIAESDTAKRAVEICEKVLGLVKIIMK